MIARTVGVLTFVLHDVMQEGGILGNLELLRLLLEETGAAVPDILEDMPLGLGLAHNLHIDYVGQ